MLFILRRAHLSIVEESAESLNDEYFYIPLSFRKSRMRSRPKGLWIMLLTGFLKWILDVNAISKSLYELEANFEKSLRIHLELRMEG